MVKLTQQRASIWTKLLFAYINSILGTSGLKDAMNGLSLKKDACFLRPRQVSDS